MGHRPWDDLFDEVLNEANDETDDEPTPAPAPEVAVDVVDTSETSTAPGDDPTLTASDPQPSPETDPADEPQEPWAEETTTDSAVAIDAPARPRSAARATVPPQE
ncbi:cell wall binding repeat family protein [Streptomyces laurentii]|uniref:Cell wall binding repeat family protein n=1 Tax=Streptomyces laurentii TaxID=39478 RepID=A0A160NWA8_STRLU|nr:cell wall binding repeat family protein [Streptomyces laurentii]